jgi:diguanylate cyclase (GGDEF)-like protein
MSLFKRGADAQPAASGAGPEIDLLLDALGAMLRAFGGKAFDIDDLPAAATQAACDRWLQHVMLGTKPGPAKPEADAEPAARHDRGTPASLPLAQRDFRGLARFFASHRGSEHAYVTQSSADLRLAIWSMVQALRAGMHDDRQRDLLAADHLKRLSEAVTANSVERIRHEARETVAVISDLIAKREERQRTEIERLASELRSLRSELDRAWDQASRDGLTGLANRAALDAYLARMADVVFLFPEPIWVFMVDIDHFKRVNDRFGHVAGDEVLRQVAKRLIQTFPRKGDLVARYGGEEFALVLQIDTPALAQRLAERLLHAVRELELEHEGQAIPISVSLGAAQLRPQETTERWIARADAALYEAKQAGRDRAAFAS